MADVAEKQYPDNYPSDALEILDAMSFQKGKNTMVMGSMAIRSQQYAGDYDGYEIVKGMSPAQLASRFKEIMKDLRGMKNVYIGDIKLGGVAEWDILNGAKVSKGKIVGLNSTAAQKKIDELETGKVITPAEAKEARTLVAKIHSPIDLLKATDVLKYHILRWTPAEVLAGRKVLRDKSVITLEDAFKTRGRAKLDVIGLTQNYRYTDFSVIYEFHYDGKILNGSVEDVADGLKNDILLQEKEGNYFKVLKRKFALAKLTNNKSVIKRLIPILNSDLGRLYQIASDIGVIMALLEDHANVPLERLRFKIDQLKGRLGNIYALPDFIKAEHDIIGDLNAAVKISDRKRLFSRLEGIYSQLMVILNRNAKAKG